METVVLTQLEQRILDHIREYIGTHQISPTIAEIADALDIRSRGTVHRYVHSLINKGELVRLGTGWRGLRIPGLRIPGQPVGQPAEQASDAASHGIAKVTATGLRDQAAVARTSPASSASSTSSTSSTREESPGDSLDTDLSIPLLGKIAAGMPIEAIPDETHLDLAAFFIGPDRYALRVSGESMIDAGILDGDTVIIRKQSHARPGDIVVALIDAQEATLKRLGTFNSQVVELIAENAQIPVMRYTPSRVSIQGVLIGQLRSY